MTERERIVCCHLCWSMLTETPPFNLESRNPRLLCPVPAPSRLLLRVFFFEISEHVCDAGISRRRYRL